MLFSIEFFHSKCWTWILKGSKVLESELSLSSGERIAVKYELQNELSDELQNALDKKF